MAGNTATSYDALLKELYSDEKVTNALFTKNKLMALMPKREDAGGKHWVFPIVYSSGQGRSVSFSAAQTMAGKTGEVSVDFFVPLQQNHADATVSSELLAQTANDKGRFLRAVSLIADNQLTNFGNDLAVGMYRSSDGSRGQIGSIGTPSGGVANSMITLKQKKDVLNFEVGMQLDVAAAKSSGGVRAYGTNGHGLYVIKVDYVAGTIVVGTTPVPGGTAIAVTDAADGIPTAAANDYIYVTGDRNLKLNGFQDWIPYGGPTVSDSFLGVNRSSNPVRLAGNWMDATSGTSLSAVLEDAIAQVGEVGGELTHFFMPYKQFALLSKELGGKAQLVDVSVNAQVGYQGIKVIGSTGPVVCLPDRACPPNTIAGVNIETWELVSVGQAVHIWDEDGKVWLRTPTEAGMEIRFFSYCNTICTAPHNNINIQVTP